MASVQDERGGDGQGKNIIFVTLFAPGVRSAFTNIAKHFTSSAKVHTCAFRSRQYCFSCFGVNILCQIMQCNTL